MEHRAPFGSTALPSSPLPVYRVTLLPWRNVPFKPAPWEKSEALKLVHLWEDFNPTHVPPPLEDKPPYKAGSNAGAGAK